MPDGVDHRGPVTGRRGRGAGDPQWGVGGGGLRPAGVNLPPPGTPVTDPVPPTQLKAGDVGVWKDHMVMALGNKQVLVNGQAQPQESVGSGPDFLGWIDPTKLANPSAQV